MAADSLFAFVRGAESYPSEKEMVGALLVADLIAALKGSPGGS